MLNPEGLRRFDIDMRGPAVDAFEEVEIAYIDSIERYTIQSESLTALRQLGNINSPDIRRIEFDLFSEKIAMSFFKKAMDMVASENRLIIGNPDGSDKIGHVKYEEQLPKHPFIRRLKSEESNWMVCVGSKISQVNNNGDTSPLNEATYVSLDYFFSERSSSPTVVFSNPRNKTDNEEFEDELLLRLVRWQTATLEEL